VQLQRLGLYSHGHNASLKTVSGDASFRRYFRTQVLSSGCSLIAVDAPAEKEDSRPFVAISQAWLKGGIDVPEVIAVDLEEGFMLLSDLGDDVYLPQLSENADVLYPHAIAALVRLQQCAMPKDYQLPIYDAEKLQQEMGLCSEWFLTQLLGLELGVKEKQCLNDVFGRLVGSAQAQPQVCVHRDYHSRNLMVLSNAQGKSEVGVLDFQDAVIGPVTYDLVSLLRDCYISWPAEQEAKWIANYMRLASQQGVWQSVDEPSYAQFKRWFEWMGLQRHIKCVGIFSRLYLRDGKTGYLQDIPRTFAYLKRVSEQYSEFGEFNDWLDNVVVPAMQKSRYFSARSSRDFDL